MSGQAKPWSESLQAAGLLHIAQEGRRWAIKHGQGYLGFVATLDEAVRLLRVLSQDPWPAAEQAADEGQG